MRKTVFLAVYTAVPLIVLGLTGCQVSEHVRGGQLFELADHSRLLVTAEGGASCVDCPNVQTKASPDEFAYVTKAKDGEPIHRLLEDAKGKVLFAYDLMPGKNESDGTYHFLLTPHLILTAAGKAPTFGATHDVAVKATESARVELMEQPDTGRKIVDVFQVLRPETARGNQSMFGAHVQLVHRKLRELFHGE